MKMKFNFIIAGTGAGVAAFAAAAPRPACAEAFMTVAQAQAALFPGETLTPSPITLTDEQVKVIEKDASVRVRNRDVKVWRARGGGVLIVDQVPGKHEMITFALALEKDGAVRQVEILEYRETYGYEIKHPAWRAQFAGKKPGAPLKLDKDVKNISGATLSCQHVTEGVRRLLATWDHVLR
jgi:Na+-translocating ferredoxin:NAD+ oxidoreductase RnfG subunit